MDNCLRLYNSRYEVESFPYDKVVIIWRKRCQRRGISNISNTSGSGSGGGSGSGSGSGGGSGSYLDIESQRNEDDVEFGMHSESNADSEFEENTTNNEMLYAINEEDFNDIDVELV